MTVTLDNYEGLQLTKNSDGTYLGTKESEIFDKDMNKTLKGTVNFSRLKIDWVDGVEFGIPERIEVLSRIKADGTDGEFWNLKIPE